jgi:hypothetical protein
MGFFGLLCSLLITSLGYGIDAMSAANNLRYEAEQLLALGRSKLNQHEAAVFYLYLSELSRKPKTYSGQFDIYSAAIG